MSSAVLSANRTHHATLYFADGDIILEAQTEADDDDTSESSILFRVHRFLLGHHSPVFRNMFSLPYPAAGGTDEVYDGVPVVKMRDDAQDLVSLLRILYHPSKLPFIRFSPETPMEVSRPLRLAKKYEIEELRARLILHVVVDWPLTLIQWDEQRCQFAALQTRLIDEYRDSEEIDTFLADCIPEPASAVGFAREFGCTEILPAAFYRLAIADITDNWDADNDCNMASLAAHHHLVRWYLLSSEDLLRILRLRNQLDSRWDASTPYSAMSPRCKSRRMESQGGDICWKVVCDLLEPLWTTPRDETFDPLEVLLDAGDHTGSSDEENLCNRCAVTLREWAAEERTQVWEHISCWLGVEYS